MFLCVLTFLSTSGSPECVHTLCTSIYICVYVYITYSFTPRAAMSTFVCATPKGMLWGPMHL